jgi:hypothetical protein
MKAQIVDENPEILQKIYQISSKRMIFSLFFLIADNGFLII